MRLTLLVSFLGLAALGCRSDDPKMMTGDDEPGIDAPPGTVENTVQDVQGDAMPVGTAVRLEGVVVTAIDAFGTRTGEFYVQEPEGGPFSGVKVFGAPLDQVSGLAVGDVVTITGAAKEEYAYMPGVEGGFPDGYSITELEPVEGGTMTVTKTGTGTTVITQVDVDAIDALPTFEERDAEWEKWEGTLFEAKKARQLSSVASFGTMPGPDSTAFRATGGIEVQSALVALPEGEFAGCFESLVGIGDYFFTYKLLPRTAADMVTGGTDCAALTTATIADVQSGAATGTVLLEDVFVTAIAFNKRNLWVSTTNTAAPNQGVYVFGGGNLPATVVPGAKVSVLGKVKEHNNDMMGLTLTELERSSTGFVAAPTGAPTPVTGVTAATLSAEATGEPYEGVLVTLTNVKVNTVGTMANSYVAQLKQGATTFIADDDIFRLLPEHAGACYASITGIWSYQVFENVYSFLPTAVGTGTGTCAP